MLNTHKILAKFEWDQLKINSNHSDEGLDLSLRSNAQDIQQINILVDLGDDKVLAQKPTVLSNQYQTKFNLPRGSYNIKKIRFFTLGESSLFYVWKNIVFKQKIYSYPNKKYFNLRELNHFNTSFINEEEFSHHIKYSGQLPAKRIDWKVFAKKDELYWKKHQGENNEVLKLSYKYFNDSLENNLSYLSYLCYEAYKNNYLFSLETHNEFIKENRGPDHLKACLEKLSEV